ncbi:MAG: putative maturation protein [Koroslivirus faecicola]|uniref:Maturation protein n=1 Tax=Leviviridae sp. TaxID=2027243 RepID=A0ABY3STW6_9VIRU|nr:MAG: putative maturation protein [Leviviridae sp.]
MSLAHSASLSHESEHVSRVRDRAKTVTSVRNIIPAGLSPSSDFFLYKEHCEDVVTSPGQEHTLLIDKIERFYDPIGGNSKNSPTDATYTVYDGKWMYEYQQPDSHCNHLSVPGLPSNSAAVIQMLSVSNPSKPEVDIPLFLYELREIPELLQYYARFWKKHIELGRNNSVPDDLLEVGNILLSYHFGIKPLIGDIQKMLDFQSHVAAKEKVLKALTARGGIHSRVKVGSGVSSEMTTPVLNAEGGIVILGSVGKITTAQMWATTRWTPDPARPLPTTPEGITDLARRAAFGLDASLDSIYNAVPWSWLLDWFGNLGDYVSTSRNTIPAKHSTPCVMKMTTTSVHGQRSGSNGAFMSGGKTFSTRHTTKTRAVMPFVLPEANLGPTLDFRKWSILGALGLQRIPRETTNRLKLLDI